MSALFLFIEGLTLQGIIPQEELLRPVLCMEGALEDGSDLILPANMTDDRRALMAVTPSETGPLTAGNHLLRLSLNGQFGGMNHSHAVSCTRANFVFVHHNRAF
jgi:hypothetical protein